MQYSLENLFSVKDRVVVVTGAGGGIGAELSRCLLQLGAKVAICSRNEQTLRRMEESVSEPSLRENLLVVPADVAYEESVQEMMEEVHRHFGSIDGLVNCAGITDLEPAEEFDMNRFRQVLEVNLTGTMTCCKAAARYMLPAGYGRIVNLSSVRGLQGKAKYSAYAASKGAVSTLTKSLAVEWATRGINVNAVAPTFVLTDINRDMLSDETQKNWVLSRIPKGTLGQASQMAGPIVFLLSPASEFVTGEILYVDGGWTAG
jgi:NAD(P)-dependent dehydrogenase (short-subunit alcohol dehydrogenase family)